MTNNDHNFDDHGGLWSLLSVVTGFIILSAIILYFSHEAREWAMDFLENFMRT